MMFRALVNFAGFIGCDEEYEIEADSLRMVTSTSLMKMNLSWNMMEA